MESAITPPQKTPVLNDDNLFTKTWYLFWNSISIWLRDLGSRVTALEAGAMGTSGVTTQEITLTASQIIPNGAVAPSRGAVMVVFVDQNAAGTWTITWGTDYEADTPVQIDPTGLTKNAFTFVGTSSAKWRIVSLWQPGL